MRTILKAYRLFLLTAFVICMIIATILLYHFFNFIQPMDYVTQSLGAMQKPGTLEVTVATSIEQPLGIVLISPNNTKYTQSSRDVISTTNGSSITIKITTAELGEWKIRYRNIPSVTVSLTKKVIDSKAAILIGTKAMESKVEKGKYIVSMTMNCRNYTYNIKAIRRKDGFSLTSYGEGGTTLELEPYAYQGVWDFYLHTIRGEETYSTVFSYTF